MYEIVKFKDHQVSVNDVKEGDIHVRIRGNSYEDLFAAASVKEAWDAANAMNKTATAVLTIYCLIGQRSDRRFNKGGSFDLKVVANFINTMKYDKVRIFHPHSAISLALIDNSEEISPLRFVKQAFESIEDAVLVSPDAGAYKTTHAMAEQLKADLIPSNKVRVKGIPQIQIQGDVNQKNCLIVDDLADGGRTFKLLAENLKAQGAKKVYLYVTHAQFNYGITALKDCIDHIYCTNSYKNINDNFITQYSIEDI